MQVWVVVSILSLMVVYNSTKTTRSFASSGFTLGLRSQVTTWFRLIVTQWSIIHHSLRASAHYKIGKILMRFLS